MTKEEFISKLSKAVGIGIFHNKNSGYIFRNNETIGYFAKGNRAVFYERFSYISVLKVEKFAKRIN